MYINRTIEPILIKLAKEYPVVTITGPRQSGKTTLARRIFKDKPYLNLELPDMRAAAQADPRDFLLQHKDGAIIDEVQRVPELLSYIQVDVDNDDIPGKFILTGSNQGHLSQVVSQSLAGRTAILNVLPFSIKELELIVPNFSANDYLYHGFFPRIYSKQQSPLYTYSSYTQTYLEKDVRQIINIRDIDCFQRFIKLCAGRIGCIINKESLANDLGVSSKTISQWFSILQASHIIFFLAPYFENFSKRITKAPKLYFTDVGLATYLLGIEKITQLNRDPLRGMLFENMVILELVKARLNLGLEPRLYYYRDNHQNEVDVIFNSANDLIPIEIKSSHTFSTQFCKGLKFYKNLVKERSPKQFLIYSGQEKYRFTDIEVLNFKDAFKCTL